MRKGIIVGILFVLAFCLTTLPVLSEAEGEELATEGEQRQTYPKYGFGAQFILPSGGISSRVWLNPRLGVEGNALAWSRPEMGISGTTSLRVLYKLTPDRSVDFYVAGGGAYNFSSGIPSFTGTGTGGISFEVFTDAFVLNLEFGMRVRGINWFNVSFGSGFHYYF